MFSFLKFGKSICDYMYFTKTQAHTLTENFKYFYDIDLNLNVRVNKYLEMDDKKNTRRQKRFLLLL